jgi:hypothetical protein
LPVRAINQTAIFGTRLKSHVDTWMTHRDFGMLRILGSALRLKAEMDLSSRGQKDFICREEKRKTA